MFLLCPKMVRCLYLVCKTKTYIDLSALRRYDDSVHIVFGLSAYKWMTWSGLCPALLSSPALELTGYAFD